MTGSGAARHSRWVRVLAGAAALVLVAAGGELSAQAVDARGADEVQRLREAAEREAAGDLAGAEQILTGILEDRPESLSALLSLQRVLTLRGRPEALLPPIERLLAKDSDSPIAHQMRVRTLSRLDRLEALEAASEAWIRAVPKLETPYREIAVVWQDRGDYNAALRVLLRGREAVRREDALALELGQVYATLGEDRRAIEEWRRAMGEDARGFSLVRRRLAALPDGGARLIPGLIDAMMAGDPAPALQRAAAELAVDAGMDRRAERIARRAAEALPAEKRQGFLVEMARRADGAHLPRLAYWAYSEIVGSGDSNPRLVAIWSRLGELALALGDTAAAREHFLVVERTYAVGSPERRQAAALRIELTARDGKVDDALREFEAFRGAYPEAPELDRLTAAVGDMLLSRGDVARAERLVAGSRGPRTELLRGRIALRSGDITQARAAFLSAAPRLEGMEATRTIALATLLGQLSPAGGALLGRALVEAECGRTDASVRILADESEGLERHERSALLDYAAELADRNDLPIEAERVRRTIVTDFPDTQVAPAALLGLARALAGRPGGMDEARQYLERLVLEYPRSALVPQARRELDRLRDRIPRS